MSSSVSARAQGWLDKRFAPSDTVKLTQRRIYILPTRAGVGYVIVALAVLLLGINYQNNLAYAVCFMMVSLFVTAILHTFSNLSGLTIKASPAAPVFAGQLAKMPIAFDSERDQQQISVGFLRESPIVFSIESKKSEHLAVSASSRWRGWFDPGLLVISTVFPFGLFKAWSRVRLQQRILVYPKPIAGGSIHELNAGLLDDKGKGKSEQNLDSLKTYIAGESFSRISWKTMAKGQGLYSLNFEQESRDDIWLSWALWPELAAEARLSRLCYWVIELTKQQMPFGLIMPGVILDPEADDAHMHAALRALALYKLG